MQSEVFSVEYVCLGSY